MDVPAPELDERHLAAWRAVLNAHAAAVGAIERELEADGFIPPTWYDVLVALAESPEQRLRLHELADSVVLSRSGMTRLVDRLERAGLLRRETCATDRRGAFAVITDEGNAMLRRTWPAYARGIANYFAQYLSAEEADEIAAVLGRVALQGRGAAR
jgi:DNA-binding MarR family transcriptional regulator